jgi:hypothetical protein
VVTKGLVFVAPSPRLGHGLEVNQRSPEQMHINNSKDNFYFSCVLTTYMYDNMLVKKNAKYYSLPGKEPLTGEIFYALVANRNFADGLGLLYKKNTSTPTKENLTVNDRNSVNFRSVENPSLRCIIIVIDYFSV